MPPRLSIVVPFLELHALVDAEPLRALWIVGYMNVHGSPAGVDDANLVARGLVRQDLDVLCRWLIDRRPLQKNSQ